MNIMQLVTSRFARVYNDNNKTDPEYERDLAVLRVTFGAAEPAHTTTWKDGR